MRYRESGSAEEIAIRYFKSCVRRARLVLPQIRAAQQRYRDPDSLYKNRQLAYWVELRTTANVLAEIIRAIRREANDRNPPESQIAPSEVQISNSRHKYDYADLEARYVSGTMSLRELARQVGMSNGTISDYARRHDWNRKRAQRERAERGGGDPEKRAWVKYLSHRRIAFEWPDCHWMVGRLGGQPVAKHHPCTKEGRFVVTVQRGPDEINLVMCAMHTRYCAIASANQQLFEVAL